MWCGQTRAEQIYKPVDDARGLVDVPALRQAPHMDLPLHDNMPAQVQSVQVRGREQVGQHGVVERVGEVRGRRIGGAVPRRAELECRPAGLRGIFLILVRTVLYDGWRG